MFLKVLQVGTINSLESTILSLFAVFQVTMIGCGFFIEGSDLEKYD